MRGPMRWRILGVLWLIVVTLDSHTVLAQGDPQKRKMDLICLTDRPAIVEGDSTRLQAWAVAPDGTLIAQTVSFVWEVTEGTIQGIGPDVRWNLGTISIKDGELRNRVKVTVNAAAIGVGDASCEITVFIGPKEQGGSDDQRMRTHEELRSARQYLLPTVKEEPGFGLYSYLLFPVKPKDNDQKAQYRRIVEECLRVMETVESHVRRHRLPRELNATHIPVNTDPEGSQVLAEWAANVLEVYDYTAAQRLLDKLDKFDKKNRRGPFLVSVRKDPLSDRSGHVQEYLVQDFTGKVPELVSQAVDLFIERAAQQRTWTDDFSFRGFCLDVRNLVAIIGEAVPEVVGRTMIMLKQASQPQ